jgi:hypothetical protein
MADSMSRVIWIVMAPTIFLQGAALITFAITKNETASIATGAAVGLTTLALAVRRYLFHRR